MDGPAVAVLVVLVGAVLWLVVEVRRVHDMVLPIAESTLVQTVAAL